MNELEIAICVAALLLGILVKAITGMGFPLIAIPVISVFVSVEDAVAVVSLPNVVMNGVLCWRTRGHAEQTRDLPMLTVTGIVGAAAGMWLLVHLPERPLLIALAVTVFAYLAHHARSPDAVLAPDTARRWSAPVGFAAGIMQGAVGVSGPLVAAWIHAYRLVPNAFVFSVTLLFLVSGAVQLVLLMGNAMLVGPRLWLGLAAIPLVLVLIPVGERLRERLTGPRFQRAVIAVLWLAGASLLGRALA